MTHVAWPWAPMDGSTPRERPFCAEPAPVPRLAAALQASHRVAVVCAFPSGPGCCLSFPSI